MYREVGWVHELAVPDTVYRSFVAKLVKSFGPAARSRTPPKVFATSDTQIYLRLPLHRSSP